VVNKCLGQAVSQNFSQWLSQHDTALRIQRILDRALESEGETAVRVEVDFEMDGGKSRRMKACGLEACTPLSVTHFS
jgi:hypothetical protein